jgi:hypothetical protein
VLQRDHDAIYFLARNNTNMAKDEKFILLLNRALKIEGVWAM